jgi:hypothetical protein
MTNSTFDRRRQLSTSTGLGFAYLWNVDQKNVYLKGSIDQ